MEAEFVQMIGLRDEDIWRPGKFGPLRNKIQGNYKKDFKNKNKIDFYINYYFFIIYKFYINNSHIIQYY